MAALVERLDGGGAIGIQEAENSHVQPEPGSGTAVDFDRQIGSSSKAPIMLLRDVAAEVGLSPEQHRGSVTDIIDKGILTTEEATSLIMLYV